MNGPDFTNNKEIEMQMENDGIAAAPYGPVADHRGGRPGGSRRSAFRGCLVRAGCAIQSCARQCDDTAHAGDQ